MDLRLLRGGALAVLLCVLLPATAPAAAAPPAPETQAPAPQLSPPPFSAPTPPPPLESLPGVSVLPAAPALPAEITAASWMVADATTGEILAARSPHLRLAPASTLKVLTAIALLGVLPPEAPAAAVLADTQVDGTKVGLDPARAYAAADLYGPMLVISANDAASALARSAGRGDHSAGIARLNATAAALGAHDTHAVNASGLDAPGQLSSAHDLALLMRTGAITPQFMRFASSLTASFPGKDGRYLLNTHVKLLTRYPGALAGKNGYTRASRASYVALARRNGRTLVVSLMRAKPTVWTEAAALFDWGFSLQPTGARSPLGELPPPLTPLRLERALNPPPSPSAAPSPAPSPPELVAPPVLLAPAPAPPPFPAALALSALGLTLVLCSVLLLRARLPRTTPTALSGAWSTTADLPEPAPERQAREGLRLPRPPHR